MLFKNSDFILEYDDRKGRNFFGFTEPKKTLGRAILRSVGDLPAANTSPDTLRERYKCILVVISQKTTRAESGQSVLRCTAYHYMATDQVTPSHTVMMHYIDHGH
jgi:hypothetical protein